MAIQLLENEWIEYTGIDVTNDMVRRSEISEISWMHTVPMIFNGDISKENLIGWYTELIHLHESWRLLDMINKK